MKLRIKYCLTAAALLGVGAGSMSAHSQTTYQSSPNKGLWRDLDGNLWCGGSCGVGQQCCDIVIK
jgi:hypothetical protein